MKKAIKILGLTALCLSCMAMFGCTGSDYDDDYGNGNYGNSSNGNSTSQEDTTKYTEISDVAGLKAMQKDGEYKLVSDIDLSGEEWMPIPEFSGVLYGNDYTIRNLSITDCEEENIGFFGTLTGTVKNVKFSSVAIDISERDCYVGAVAGKLQGTVENVSISGDVTAEKSAACGGVAGQQISGEIKSIKNDGLTITANSYVGGIIGYCNSTITLDEVKNEAAINGKDYVGGLYGYINGSDLTIENCENIGSITGSGNFVGGLVGFANAYNAYSWSAVLRVIDSSNEGDIKGIQCVGGLFGYAYGEDTSSLIEDCSNQSDIEAEAIVGCLAGELWKIGLKNCTNSGSTLQATKYITENSNKYAYVGGYAGKGYSATKCTNMVDINYAGEGMYVGGIIGYCNSTITLDEVKNEAAISGKDYIGGLYGYINGSDLTIENCENIGSITGSGNFVGGLVGFANAYNEYSWSAVLRVIDSSNEGDVKGIQYVGGLFGYAYGENASSLIMDCTSSGSVSGSSNYGTYIGYNDKNNITIS